MTDLSPLERLRTTYEARQQTRTTDVPVWADGSLVARIGMVDTNGARDAMRTLMRLMSDDAGDLTEHDLAGVLAAATQGLYVPGDDGELEPLLDEQGNHLAFDANLAAAIGRTGVSSPVGAVIATMTEGDPPTVNSLRLLTLATQVAGWLLGDGAEDAEDSLSGL